jgi:hypothetical protein
MSVIRFAATVCVVAVVCATASSARAQEFADSAAIVQFQRSVDSYAFQHRQIQRRLGEGAEQRAMASGMHAARPSADGDYFTPIIASAFRNRIAFALRTQDCKVAAAGTSSSEVPRVGSVAPDTYDLPKCVLSVLPRLPEELEYRAASVAIILLDTHANMVVDVLHGAFPAQP